MPTHPGRSAALVVAHVAGMIDLVALSVWIGTSMQHFQFDPQRAGMLVAIVCSAFFAMVFTRTFLFGLRVRIDTTARAVTTTPAMLMAGSTVGPLIGGILIAHPEHEAIGIAGMVISAISFLLLIRLRWSSPAGDKKNLIGTSGEKVSLKSIQTIFATRHDLRRI
jgi:predicted MFS family arabinose efflux permease